MLNQIIARLHKFVGRAKGDHGLHAPFRVTTHHGHTVRAGILRTSPRRITEKPAYASMRPMRKAPKNPLHGELLQKRIAELEAGMRAGGLRAAVIRGILYAGMPRASIDERGAEALRRIREAQTDLTLSAFKVLVREQYNMLLIDQEAALAAIPSMLPPDTETRVKAFDLIRQVLAARGAFSAEESVRLSEIARLFGIDQGGITGPTPLRPVRTERQAKASR